MKAQITLKSGIQIVADIDELTTARHPITNRLTEIAWATPENWTTKLHTVVLEEIAAIVVIRTTDTD